MSLAGARPSVNEYNDKKNHPYASCEYLPKAQPSCHQARLHSWSSDLATELQPKMWPDEVVVAPEELEVVVEILPASGVAGTPAGEIRRSLPDGQVHPLDEGCVEVGGILLAGKRVVKLMGDGALVEFASVVDAVACAIAIQSGMTGRNAGLSEQHRIEFRIGC